MKLNWKVAVAVALSGVWAQAASFTGLIDFGDSLSDAGNVKNVTTSFGGAIPITPGSPGYSNGRFSNGAIWVQKLGPALGVAAPTASTAGGTDFAYGGVTSGTGSTSFILPNVQKQIGDWTAVNTPTTTQLFTVLGGANDLFNTLNESAATPAARLTVATTAAANIAAGVQALYNDGARNILVSNLPDLGLTPRYRGSSQQADATTLTNAFDVALAANLGVLQTSASGLNLYRLDLQTLFASAIANPAAYGLTNVTGRAYTGDDDFVGNGTSVADPSGYLFWDAVHPTTAGHQIIANAALAAVPEPSMALVLVGLTAVMRRRRA